MLKIGHRGAKGHVAENTIESFLKAFELGADGIELDVHLSADGEAVVIHDETVDRTIKNAAGFVKDFTVDEFKKLGIPTLVEVFHILPEDKLLNIEIKDPLATKIVVEEIGKILRLGEIQLQNILVSSFAWPILKEVKELNSLIRIGVLTEGDPEAALVFAKEISAFSIHPFFGSLNGDFVGKAKQNGFQIHTWTVNSSEDITFVRNLGVDAIISDFPDRL
ncbi:glycerophosphodiester phosphodiesterase [Flavobacterium amniphilum]|uniref:glycerophosphodiester phosphodiesterase n=1 Tax=Flavobacterium amniphilum TaxID=1834035 RepID=UPI00202AAF30|nr:glycerophosphodiester phosphodiesterase family protein [Flavobacterium amniphilum]MCL9806505.1 glycerophosphodiester phosphodiesterase [Flavobacterium amniphilum]